MTEAPGTTTKPFWLIAIAASAGGIKALQTVLSSLPASLPAAVLIVQHRSSKPERILDSILARVSALPVSTPLPGDAIRPGRIYLARPDLHLSVLPSRHFAYTDGTRIRGVLSSANPLFESSAEAFGDRAIAVVLSGSGYDATDGVQKVKARGGVVIIQDPKTAEHGGMPRSALQTGAVDRVLPLTAIGPALVEITSGAATAPMPG